jgi:hypothetical protein
MNDKSLSTIQIQQLNFSKNKNFSFVKLPTKDKINENIDCFEKFEDEKINSYG